MIVSITFRSIRAAWYGVRYAWRRYWCQCPAMQRASVVLVGATYCVGGWHCYDCGRTLTDRPQSRTR